MNYFQLSSSFGYSNLLWKSVFTIYRFIHELFIVPYIPNKSSNLYFGCLLLPDLILIFPIKHDLRPNQPTVTTLLLHKENRDLGFNQYRFLPSTLMLQLIALNTVSAIMVNLKKNHHITYEHFQLGKRCWVNSLAYNGTRTPLLFYNLSYNHSNNSTFWEHGIIISNLVCQ